MEQSMLAGNNLDEADNPLISVIIPTYNRESTIERSIRSVLSQSYSNIELIVVDDGSTDNTRGVVLSIQDNRLKYVFQTNNGACAARNKGIEMAQGEYIAFQDSDDEWIENKLEKQMLFLSEMEVDFVACKYSRYLNETPIKMSVFNNVNQIADIERLLCGNFVSTQTMLLKKTVASEVIFDVSFKKLQDWDFALCVLEKGFSIGFQDESLVKVNVSKHSISTDESQIDALQMLLSKHLQYYKQYPNALSMMYLQLAKAYPASERSRKQQYLAQSLRCKMRLKTIIKMILNKFGLWG